MATGELFVTTTGILMTHKWFAVNWVFLKLFALPNVHSLVKEMGTYGCTMYAVWALKVLLRTAHTVDGKITTTSTASTTKTLQSSARMGLEVWVSRDKKFIPPA